MQDLAHSIWPELGGLTILPRQPFYELAKQKLSDYRNSVASEAVNAVNKFMRSARFKHSPAERAKWVAWTLSEEHGFPFRYEKVLTTHTDTTRKVGAYRHKLVVKTLAYHVKRVQKPVDQMREHPPHNALALAVTAVERALKMWESGEFIPPKLRTEENKFWDRLWGRTANQYMGSIVSLSEEQWEGILQLTEQHARGLVPDCDDDGSDTDTGDYDPSAIPTSGGRATIEEDCEFDEPQDNRLVNDGRAGRGRQ
ncbi:hypothetical protein BD413DRAFT_599026 [Trametes elegans]|nr:hypothetical protein BD413DRAFT_599026 [Trametes elegans]